MSIARDLALRSSLLSNYIVKEYMRARGPVRQYVVPDELLVSVEYETPYVVCDAVR